MTRAAQRETTRRRLLEAARRVFLRRGFHAASLRELASRVGMSHPGLLHHFPTKVALLEAVLDHRDTVDEADLDDDLARGTDYFDALVHLVERNAVRRHIVELFTALSAEATSPEHPAHEYFVRRYRWAVARTSEQLVRRARAGGLLRDRQDALLLGAQPREVRAVCRDGLARGGSGGEQAGQDEGAGRPGLTHRSASSGR